MPLKKVLIAAGGTGGHIYPALAIAQALQRAAPDCKITFVGTRHGLENKIVPAAGFSVAHIPIGRLNSNVSKAERISTLLQLPLAFLKSIWLLFRYRPDLVLGCGGHASGPMLLMAALLGKRTVIFEPNAMPGLANRILAKFVDECVLVFEETKKYLRCKSFFQAGMPVRNEMEQVPAHSRGSRMHIFSFGGSQGSRGLNTAICETMMAGRPWSESVELVQQTGPQEFKRVEELYGTELRRLPIELKDYIHDMDQRYAWADVVIARSGTGTLSELAATGKPSILIPLPTAADNHQQKNAEQFVHMGAAVMILQKDLTGVGLRETLKDLWSHPEKLEEMGRRAKSFHRPGAAEKIVRHLMSEAGQ